MRTRRHEKRPRRGRRDLMNEETGRNRLQTRALYDTETEVNSLFFTCLLVDCVTFTYWHEYHYDCDSFVECVCHLC